jgi:hypothetical protein
MQRRTRRLSFESLEIRALLAGNVTASINDGIVTIIGDDAANAIRVGSQGFSGQTMEGAPTSINGVPNGSFDWGPGAFGIRIQMQGGGDFVRTDNTVFSLVADMGAGNDNFLGFIMRTSTELIVDGGDGDDAITLTGQERLNRFRNTIGTSAVLRGGAGGDLIDLTNTDASRELVIYGGAGSDLIKTLGGSVSNLLYISGEAGSDRIEVSQYRIQNYLTLDGGEGFNSFKVDTASPEIGMAVYSGSDADYLETNGGALGYTAFIMGGGNDYMIVTIAGFVGTDWLGLIMGDGADYVVVGGAIDQLYADMGSGDDGLQVVNTKLGRAIDDFTNVTPRPSKSGYFEGGPGGDFLQVINSLFDFSVLRNWEGASGITDSTSFNGRPVNLPR